MKKKNVLIGLSVSIIILAIILIGAVIGWKHLSDYSTTLKANWSFSIPSDAHYAEIYHQNDEPSFHGDGIRYHVFSYKEAEPISKMFVWQSSQQNTIFHDSYSEATEDWLDAIHVPLEQRPNYTQCTYWYQSQDDNSEIILFWDNHQNRIYIVESFL